MASATPFDCLGIDIQNAIPQREEHAVVLRHWIQFIQTFKHGGGIAHVATWNRATANGVHGAHSKQRRTNSVSAHVKQVNSQA